MSHMPLHLRGSSGGCRKSLKHMRQLNGSDHLITGRLSALDSPYSADVLVELLSHRMEGKRERRGVEGNRGTMRSPLC